MKNSIIGIVIMLMAISGFANKDTDLEKEKVQKICDQGVLLQKMVKDFMMMGIGFKKKESRMDLDECVADYEMTRLFFEDISVDEKTQLAIDKTDTKWMDFRLEVTDKVTPENAYKLFKTNESLLNTNKQLLQFGCESCDLNSISGYLASKELEMLSERIAMLYFAHTWGIKKEVSLRYFSDAVRIFDKKLKQLKSMENNNLEIGGKLMTLEVEWRSAKQLFGHVGMSDYNNEQVYEATSNFRNSFNSLAKLYGELADKEKLASKNLTSPD